MSFSTTPTQQDYANAGAELDIFLGAAIESLDSRFGEGYAKRNPALVITALQVQSTLAQQMRKCRADQQDMERYSARH